MNCKRLTATVVLGVLSLAPSAHASDRVRIVLNGIYNTSTLSFNDTRSYKEYAETARVGSDYSVGGGFGFDGGLQVSFYKGLGVLVGYTATNREEKGAFDASLPHPLFLSRPRTLDGNLSGFEYKEASFYADLAYVGGKPGGHLEWVLFAGASFFQVKVDFLDRITYNQSYPYDSVTLRDAPAANIEESPVGWNAGGRLDYRFGKSRRFGAGVMARYSAATVKTRGSTESTEVSFDAGGFEVGAGIRIYF